ncbi:hypothetical protein M406DRAFT_47488 [Cryphonectria parasitica EP155]|uniref:Zn(2)-C6 fungal-type domain-containing protein n=1 Tax=Cryphonectria parasitica (strain ATCC 38755 / EP155) TaxID=660469 RepID=A0A9P4XTH0_CRYP1|nr:uncharacterized protein M406DRAFT_47488 [Cryphonectria parasitica EP155]KAF3760709.1 hypothetical protein M406DRAFT_47488 [Cryphonectria parasitica EP155]
MSPPLSHLERGDPPPRRKSCSDCVKAKRRCSQTFPTCLRCAQRKLLCRYPSQARITLVLDASWPGDEHFDTDLTVDSFGTIQDPALSSVPSWTDSTTALFENESGEAGLISTTTDMYKPVYPTRGVSPRSSLQVAPPRHFNLEAINQEVQNRLLYAMDQIKSAPKTMLAELQTPWCHPALYRDEVPQVMQGAIAACALYTSKNAINGPVIMRCIDTKVNGLLNSETPRDLLHALARTHAMMLYQITRFFDGDIVARCSADAMFTELQSSALALASYTHWDAHATTGPPGSCETVHLGGDGGVDASSLLSLQALRQFWRDWVLHESARRTHLIACFFMKVWKLLTGRQVAECGEDVRANLVGRNWTLSAHLWHARDPYEFAIAWRDKKHYVVKRRSILSTMADAKGDDVESFGKMLLTVGTYLPCLRSGFNRA